MELDDSYLEQAIEVVPGRLFFVALPAAIKAPQKTSCVFYNTNGMKYQKFFADHGPLNLGHLHYFCQLTNNILLATENAKSTVYYFCSDHPHQRSICGLMAAAYPVIVHGITANESFTPFLALDPPLAPFRDAAFGLCTAHLSILSALRGIERAVSLGHYNFNTFDLESYKKMNELEHGDINFVLPGKLAAFSGPLAQRKEHKPGSFTLTPKDYVPIFRRLGIKCVVRFNKKCYDKRYFTEAGIRHVDLFYEDGGNPPPSVYNRFLQVCEETKGVVAVHCKAGLGRTGTNIALYMMKHFSYTAREAIAWCRLCRPGSVVGPQFHFLLKHEQRMKEAGRVFQAAAAAMAADAHAPPCELRPHSTSQSQEATLLRKPRQPPRGLSAAAAAAAREASPITARRASTDGRIVSAGRLRARGGQAIPAAAKAHSALFRSRSTLSGGARGANFSPRTTYGAR